jgi:hypothetical protein
MARDGKDWDWPDHPLPERFERRRRIWPDGAPNHDHWALIDTREVSMHLDDLGTAHRNCDRCPPAGTLNPQVEVDSYQKIVTGHATGPGPHKRKEVPDGPQLP